MSNDESETVGELLESAEDHKDRAEKLREQAKKRIINTIEDDLPEGADVELSTEYDSGVRVIVNPEEWMQSIRESFRGEEVSVHSTPATVTVGEMEELSRQERIQGIRDIIERLAERHEEGASKSRIINHAASELGFGPDQTEHELTKLKERGEIYETKANYFRVV